MRNWPYAYALGADPKSPVSGKFDVTVLPKSGDNGKHVACLGGWKIFPRWFDVPMNELLLVHCALPASSFVVILSLDWLEGDDRAAVSAKTHGWNYLAYAPLFNTTPP